MIMDEFTILNTTVQLPGIVESVSALPVLNTTDAYHHSNASAIPEPSPTVKQESNFHCSEGMYLYRFIIQVGLTLPICVVGICGNSLAFAVLCYQKQKASTTLLLQALSIADTILLVMAIALRSTRYIDQCFGNEQIQINYSWMYIIMYPCAFTFRMINAWLTTFLTFDRWIAVCRPLHAQRLVTKKMALIHMTIVILGAIVISIPRFFENVIQVDLQRGRYRVLPTSLSENTYYTIIYKIFIFLTAMYIIPMSTMSVLNVKLVKALKTADKDRKVLQPSSETIHQNRIVTAMVIVVVAVFLVCNILPFLSHILYSIELAFPDLEESVIDPRRKLSNISDLMLSINSAINFIIYCACSKKFRKDFVSMFSCKKKSDLNYLNKAGHSSTSGLTYLSLTRSRSSSASAHKSADRAQTYA